MPWKNFHIWRGRLPHWRADDVVYYVTFRHRRPLEDSERAELLRALMKINPLMACVLPEQTELMCALGESPKSDLSQIVERAKSKAGKAILKRTEERYPPFYTESYDRIVRDQAEYEERWQAILSSPVDAELAESPTAYPHLYISNPS